MKAIKLFLPLFCSLLLPGLLPAQNAWINEIHYDNSGTDADEFIEVVLENAGSYNLSDFSVILYNGGNGAAYDTRTLDTFTAGSVIGNFSVYWFNYTAAGISIQNGAPDGMAIAYLDTLVGGQFLSYEGTFMASGGPALGVNSADIGVSESGSTPVGYSLQLGGSGSNYSGFAWQGEAPATPGSLNYGQTIGTTILPEPENYPENFEAGTEIFTVTLTWNDAAGGQLPKGYLIKGSEDDDIVLPSDSVPEPDDYDFSDGKGARNVPQGFQTVTFLNLKRNTTYYFGIFPFTNGGADINYKTDGTFPGTQATTADITVIAYKDFEDLCFAPWENISLAGAGRWELDSCEGNHFTVFRGEQPPETGDDWLISPFMDFSQFMNETLSLRTSSGDTNIKPGILISTDYETGTDPSAAVWTEIPATLSPGNWTWTFSGNIGLSDWDGPNVHLAVRYVTDTVVSAWAVDEILVSGDPQVGTGSPGLNSALGISPNPARDKVIISTWNYQVKDIRILDMLGNVRKSVRTSNSTEPIMLEGLGRGIYFIRVSEPGSSRPKVQKLIVE